MLRDVLSPECLNCQKREVSYFTFTGFSTDAIRAMKYLTDTPHIVYLNLFGFSLLKVGVASEWRKERRVLEQGSWASLFIAHADGIVARKIESVISKELGVRQMIRVDEKVKSLLADVDAPRAREFLLSHFVRVREKLNGMYAQNFFDAPEFRFNFDAHINHGYFSGTMK